MAIIFVYRVGHLLTVTFELELIRNWAGGRERPAHIQNQGGGRCLFRKQGVVYTWYIYMLVHYQL